MLRPYIFHSITAVYCSIFPTGMRLKLICLPTQSGLLLATCYLSFSPTAWKIMGSRGSSQAKKASGNRLRHELLACPHYLHSPLWWDPFSLSFPWPCLCCVKSQRVLSSEGPWGAIFYILFWQHRFIIMYAKSYTHLQMGFKPSTFGFHVSRANTVYRIVNISASWGCTALCVFLRL